MFNPRLGIIKVVARHPAARPHYGSPAGIVKDETAWRALPAGTPPTSREPRIVATRWRSIDQQTREVSAETPADRHLVAIVLRNENVCLSMRGRVVHDGPVVSGMVQVTEPAVSARCLFRGPYDVIHLHVPNALIAELCRTNAREELGELRPGAVFTQDAVIERLGRALLAAEETGGPLGQLSADCINTAIVARLLALHRGSPGAHRPKVAELARWRLLRVIEYVEANFAEPVSLNDLAGVAGLTRMHFAAQFRAATGSPPHQYLLRRRIERAQELLIDDAESLVNIALSVGFQTQSHFTSVFKRFVGLPPRAWRQCHAGTGRYGEPHADWAGREQTQHAVAA
jgi:AraC family transcriptional regulator